MASDFLTKYQYNSAQDPFGLAAQAIASSAPALYNPYGSTGSNIGTALGAALLSGLLGGIANNRTESRNDELFKIGSQLYDATPAQRQQLISENTAHAGRLRPLVEALQEQELEQRLKQQEKILTAQQSVAKDMGGYVDSTGQFNRMYDPIQQEIEKAQGMARARTIGEALGQQDVFGGDASNIPGTPTYERNADIFDRELKLRNEYTKNPIVQDFQTSDIGFRSLVKAAQDPHPTADLELVRGAIQAIEPGMAVREGEAAAVEASRSIPDQWKGAINKALLNGASLDKDVREGIIRIAARRYEQYSNQVTALRGQYTSLAETESLTPDKILLGATPSPVEEIFPGYRQSAEKAQKLARLEELKRLKAERDSAIMNIDSRFSK